MTKQQLSDYERLCEAERQTKQRRLEQSDAILEKLEVMLGRGWYVSWVTSMSGLVRVDAVNNRTDGHAEASKPTLRDALAHLIAAVEAKEADGG